MTNSEFINLKTKLTILFIKKLLLGTIVFIATTATIYTLFCALHLWNYETTTLIYITISGAYILVYCTIASNKHNKIIKKLETLWRQDVDQEKAIEELGMLPVGDLVF